MLAVIHWMRKSMLQDANDEAPRTASVWRTDRLVMMGDTDASGLIYFPVVSRWLAETFEPWLAAEGQSIPDQIATGFAMPNVHAEVDILAPLGLGDTVTIAMWVSEVGTHSFRFRAEIHRGDGVLAITAETAHVWVRVLEVATAQPPTIAKAPVPDWLRAMAA
jgi:acyl-CoA thioesterase FadM